MGYVENGKRAPYNFLGDYGNTSSCKPTTGKKTCLNPIPLQLRKELRECEAQRRAEADVSTENLTELLELREELPK